MYFETQMLALIKKAKHLIAFLIDYANRSNMHTYFWKEILKEMAEFYG